MSNFKLIFIVLTTLLNTIDLTDVSYYELLGISNSATTKEIRQVYKKLAIKLHPDKNPNKKDQELFMKINEAYETLKDPEKRHLYDLHGKSSISYTRKYDHNSQKEFDFYYNKGLYHNDPFVHTVTGSGFYQYLSEGFHFINFYSPFCSPCRNLADTWKKLAELYRDIVRIGAVNCKLHNSFCGNSNIMSYPSLLFYPNGKHGNYVYYRGERTLEALDQFIMSYLKIQVYIPRISQLRGTDSPIAYILGTNRIDKDVQTRLAYRLKGLVSLVLVKDDSLRDKLTNKEYVTVVYKYKEVQSELESTDEKELLQDILDLLPEIEPIDPERFKDIRNKLRDGYKTPWVLFFSSMDTNRLQLHQMRRIFRDMHFGEIDCEKWFHLCLSLQIEKPPAWAVLKQGGAYQRAAEFQTPRDFLHEAPNARTLHTLSASELKRILDGDMGVWVLLVVPYHASWAHLSDTITEASLHFSHLFSLNFGIMMCTQSSVQVCRDVTANTPVIMLQNGTNRVEYDGDPTAKQLIEFIDVLRETSMLQELNVRQVLEIQGALSRNETWLIAHLPFDCGSRCGRYLYQMKVAAKKLSALNFVRVGIHQCTRSDGELCEEFRTATVGVYPRGQLNYYTTSLLDLAEIPYLLQWALDRITGSILSFNDHTFISYVFTDELHPTGGKKPWLVYFHSPRCYRCYQMYPDFVIAGTLLEGAVQMGKVNCMHEYTLCRREEIHSYPSLKLFMSRNHRQSFASVIALQVKEYQNLIQEIREHLSRYDGSLLPNSDIGTRGQHFTNIKRDEL